MKNKVLFYSSVNSKRMFSIQEFYRTDIRILKELGYKVILSNSILDFFLFQNYDIAFIYFYRFGLFSAIIAKIFNKKTVLTGGIDYLNKEYAGLKSYYIQKYFFILCSFFADKIILVSNSDKNNISKFIAKLPISKYPLSFHVIDFIKYQYNYDPEKCKLIVTIAWMLNEENVIRKGVDKSLYLFKKLHEFDNEFRMIIIGPQGHGTQIIREIIKKENLEGLVTLTGAISEKDKISILKRSSIYSQLSYYEGFGIAAIEALASGNIVVHTGKGGLADGIGSHGILVENDDYDEIAQKVNTVLTDPQCQLKMIKQGIIHVSENFKYEKRLNDFQNILTSLK